MRILLLVEHETLVDRVQVAHDAVRHEDRASTAVRRRGAAAARRRRAAAAARCEDVRLELAEHARAALAARAGEAVNLGVDTPQ